ncbi:Heavy metal-associated isoprenylated plant protein 23 [Sesamum angolense]|uniref:Heavy metal-associated isoprenylated plant protein 23 n=1 Tax=Sesamum angolense TaxID=2727404 RepID=A0AAE1W801_9LAMI|nr:Heavy metal-associated isoprenylated plant protein 23 [Sesamum angolense]
MMVPEMEKPRITEIKVRMDCNGCVHKIKKALHGITGIYDLYVDFPQQKITIVGWADPAKIVKAIKKTRKTAIICSHTEQSDEPAQPTPEPAPENSTPEGSGEAPPPTESTNPQSEQPPTEAAPPAEAQKEPPTPPAQPENPPTEAKPSQEPDNDPPSQSSQPSKPKEHEEIHVIYHHPPDYGSRYAYPHYVPNDNSRQWNAYPTGPGFRVEPPQPPQPPQSPQPPQPVYVTHSYNTYRPSPYTTEYAYPQSPPGYSYYSRPDNYNQVYYNGSNSNGNGNGNITSIFSEENPNACTIV